MSPPWGGKFPSMELKNIDIAFLTHIHSDHSGALSDLILTHGLWVGQNLSIYMVQKD